MVERLIECKERFWAESCGVHEMGLTEFDKGIKKEHEDTIYWLKSISRGLNKAQDWSVAQSSVVLSRPNVANGWSDEGWAALNG